ncbi:MAG: hypothetical protein KAU28_04755, partial [Phycisphaerae bacterium]|nr:hypothetical protein [Phycisphaerae bacterium]
MAHIAPAETGAEVKVTAMSVKAKRLDIYRTAIPMRSFDHAAASRDLAEAVVVRISFSDGVAGWGETLPRPYVTGETIESVIADITETLWPAAAQVDVAAGGDEVWQVPDRAGDGRCICAAACAMDLAMLRRLFGDVAALDPQLLLRITGRTRVRMDIDAKVSDVLGSADPAKTARHLRLMRLFGMSDFKLKLGLGDDADAENLRVVDKQLAKGIRQGRFTLRVDVNGGWDADTTPQRVAELKAYNVCVVEQPVFCPAGELVELARRCELPLMADESLITEADAAAMLAEPKRLWWNIRLSKNGGLLRSLSLAHMAAKNGVPFTLGCMVGESGILSAAQRRFLQLGAHPLFLEGNYGR